mgnify:CR=1 FL=1
MDNLQARQFFDYLCNLISDETPERQDDIFHHLESTGLLTDSELIHFMTAVSVCHIYKNPEKRKAVVSAMGTELYKEFTKEGKHNG